jgi:hypothetical protein
MESVNNLKNTVKPSNGKKLSEEQIKSVKKSNTKKVVIKKVKSETELKISALLKELKALRIAKKANKTDLKIQENIRQVTKDLTLNRVIKKNSKLN